MTSSQKFWAEIRQQLVEARRELKAAKRAVADLTGAEAVQRLGRDVWLERQREASIRLAIARDTVASLSDRLHVHQTTGRDTGGNVVHVAE